MECQKEIMGPGQVLQRVRPESGNKLEVEKEGLRQTLQLASVFAFITVAVHVVVNLRAQHVGYQLFRDEMYYIVCGTASCYWIHKLQAEGTLLHARQTEMTGQSSLR
jgi:hypothetical protein